MIRKGSKLYSIFFGTCPKCHEESMYREKNPYRVLSTLKMHNNCSNCGLKYQIEPSFFYGSMYVSYAVSVAFAVAAFVISFVFFNASLITAFLCIVITLVLLIPFIMRLSRNIWINLFIKYNKGLKK